MIISRLIYRMSFVIEDIREWVVKNRNGFRKANAVLVRVGRRFVFIPFKSQTHLT